MALLLNNAVKAQSDIISKKVVEQTKAIVAYEMNVLSLEGKDKKVLEEFKRDAAGKQTVEEIKKCLPSNLTKNKNLCDDIKKLKEDFSEADALIAYYSDSIFHQEKGEIKAFVEKRKKEEMGRLQKDIKEKVTKMTNEVAVLYEENTPLQKVQPEAEKETSAPAEENSNEPSIPFMGVVKMAAGYLLAVIAIVAAAFLFKTGRNLAAECDKLENTLKKKDKLLQTKDSEVKDLQNKVEQLKEECANLKEDNKLLKEDVKHLEEARAKQIRLRTASADGGNSLHEKEVRPQPTSREYYLGIPQDGRFVGGSDTYRPGKAIYKVTSTDETYGEFEYINLPEAIGFAKQSRTSFLESACNIIGDNKADFTQIETKLKGKVERTSDGWKIIKKADVCLV